jgi:hypothetical protein
MINAPDFAGDALAEKPVNKTEAPTPKLWANA